MHLHCCQLLLLLPNDSVKIILTHIVRERESIGESNVDGGGGDAYSRSAEPILVSLSDSYLDEDSFSQ